MKERDIKVGEAHVEKGRGSHNRLIIINPPLYHHSFLPRKSTGKKFGGASRGVFQTLQPRLPLGFSGIKLHQSLLLTLLVQPFGLFAEAPSLL